MAVVRTWNSFQWNLFAFELAFEVGEGEAEGGGAAVGAVGGAIDLFFSREEGGDFVGGEGVSGFDGGFAGGHVEDFVEEFFGGEFGADFEELVEEVAEEFPGGDFGEEGREGVDGDGLGVEVGDFDAEFEKEGFDGFEGGGVAWGDGEDFGEEEALAFEGAAGDAGVEFFVEDAFVEGVLVDDDEAVGGFGDDVGVVGLHEFCGGRSFEFRVSSFELLGRRGCFLGEGAGALPDGRGTRVKCDS